MRILFLRSSLCWFEPVVLNLQGCGGEVGFLYRGSPVLVWIVEKVVHDTGSATGARRIESTVAVRAVADIAVLVVVVRAVAVRADAVRAVAVRAVAVRAVAVDAAVGWNQKVVAGNTAAWDSWVVGVVGVGVVEVVALQVLKDDVERDFLLLCVLWEKLCGERWSVGLGW